MILKFFLQCFCVCSMALVFVGCAGIPRQRTPFVEGLISFDSAEMRQLVEVLPSSKDIFKAELIAWTYDHGVWRKAFGPWPAVIGRNGFAPVDGKREGDGKTPSGIYAIGTAFGKDVSLRTGLPYRQAAVDDIWVDDVTSAQYNQWVRMPTEALSYEKMLRADGLYDLGAVVEYNTDPVVPGRGSAIFIHIWRDGGKKPTAGCVALGREHLRRLLVWLKADLSPAIVLGTLNP